jgi:hypothetical protein
LGRPGGSRLLVFPPNTLTQQRLNTLEFLLADLASPVQLLKGSQLVFGREYLVALLLPPPVNQLDDDGGHQ